jgi:hypothetical protein
MAFAMDAGHFAWLETIDLTRYPTRNRTQYTYVVRDSDVAMSLIHVICHSAIEVSLATDMYVFDTSSSIDFGTALRCTSRVCGLVHPTRTAVPSLRKHYISEKSIVRRQMSKLLSSKSSNN